MQIDSSAHPNSARTWRWPAAIIALLCLHAAAMVTVIFVATRDPSFAVEPNSYRKAVRWDSAQAARQASAQLGWTVSVETEPVPDPLGRRLVRCTLQDKQSVPVVAALVTLELFHHARAAERLRVTLNPEEHGIYSALVPMRRSGTWEMRVTARRGNDHFSSTSTRRVGPNP